MSFPTQPLADVHATPATPEPAPSSIPAQPQSATPDPEPQYLTVEEGTAIFSATEHCHANTYRELAR